jgi:hypothetical protein
LGSNQSSFLGIDDGTTIGKGLTAVLPNGVGVVNLGSNALGQPAPVIGGDVNLQFGYSNDVLNMIDDTVDKSAVQILGNINVNLGHGDNRLLFGSAAFVAGNFDVTAGNGNDSIGLPGPRPQSFDGTVNGNLAFALNAGDNLVLFAGSVFGSNLQIQTAGGDDSVSLGAFATAPGAQLSVVLGSGADSLTVNSVDFYSAYLDGGNGTADQFNSSVVIPITWTLTGFEL